MLVGGAVVEFYTGSAVTSGDFDVITGAEEAFEEELLALGFKRLTRAGQLERGLVHPEHLVGVEIVSGPPFDGRMDRRRVVLVDVGGASVSMIPIEDLIADRMGQYASAPQGVPEMFDQAISLYRIAGDLDRAYLERRISEETLGDKGLADLEAAVREKTQP